MAAEALTDAPADTPASRRPVAVLGGGVIGMSWAALFVANGLDVRVWDPAPAMAERAAASLPRQVADARRLLRSAPPPGAWSVCDTPAAAVSGAGFVQESGPEHLPAKQALFAHLAPALAHDAVVASSTSSIMPSSLQEGCAFAERLLVGHPFNPPHLMPLVEVVGGRRTSEAAVELATAFYRGLGKHPVRLRTERLGHLANRLQAALWREAVDAVASGAASVADVDAAVTHALGPRWALLGPHATFHLAGGTGGLAHFVDHLGPAFVAQWNDLKQPTLSAELVQALVAGVTTEFGDHDVEILARQRDERLITLLTEAPPVGAPVSTSGRGDA